MAVKMLLRGCGSSWREQSGWSGFLGSVPTIPWDVFEGGWGADPLWAGSRRGGVRQGRSRNGSESPPKAGLRGAQQVSSQEALERSQGKGRGFSLDKSTKLPCLDVPSLFLAAPSALNTPTTSLFNFPACLEPVNTFKLQGKQNPFCCCRAAQTLGKKQLRFGFPGCQHRCFSPEHLSESAFLPALHSQDGCSNSP